MNHRIIELKALESSITANKTITIDLDMIDPISEIYIDSRVKNGAGGDSTEHPILSLEKVEIIDGSDVLFSLNGPEIEALDIYHSGIFPRGGWFNYLGTTVTDRQLAISFGRYLWDEELAFDPSKFSNPQLRIIIDYDAGGMNPSECQISVLAAVFDEKIISPIGFFMTKEVKQWAGAATTHEYTDCPIDYPYRKMLLQSRYAGSPPYWIFSNIKLASDHDKKIIFDGEFRDLLFGIGRENAFIKELLTGGGAAALKTGHCTPTVDVMGVASQWRNDTHGGAVATYNGDGGQYQWWSEVAQNTVHHIQGWAPHGTLCIPFGKQDVIADWFDVSRIGNLKLDVTSGVATAIRRLFIQQLRSY